MSRKGKGDSNFSFTLETSYTDHDCNVCSMLIMNHTRAFMHVVQCMLMLEKGALSCATFVRKEMMVEIL